MAHNASSLSKLLLPETDQPKLVFKFCTPETGTKLMASTILLFHFDGQNATNPALKRDSSCCNQLLLINNIVINSLHWYQWYQWFGTGVHGRRAKFLRPV